MKMMQADARKAKRRWESAGNWDFEVDQVIKYQPVLKNTQNKSIFNHGFPFQRSDD